MIVNIPIEPIPMRYSVDWDYYFSDIFHKNNIPHITIKGTALTEGIERGEFLDCVGTNFYKSSQLMDIINKIYRGTIKDGDVLFFHDIWFPGIEQIAYIRDTLNLNLKITGCLHAGSYDPNDFLYKSKTGKWAIHFEHSLFCLADIIFVATDYHKDLILKSRSVEENKILVTGFPIFDTHSKIVTKEKIIVFPHRLAEEKNHLVFDELENYFKNKLDWSWIKSSGTGSKEDYYSLLDKSSIAISLADQETWGIAMQECCFAGCITLVPDKLSYKEMYLSEFRYSSLIELMSKIEFFTKDPIIRTPLHLLPVIQKNILLKRGRIALNKIVEKLSERIH